MNRDEAVDILNQVDALARQTRASIETFWQLPGLWTLLSLGSVPLAAMVKGAHFLRALLVYWLVAALVGVVASFVLHSRRGIRIAPSRLAVGLALAVLVLTPLGGEAVMSSTGTGTSGFVAAAALAALVSWATKSRLTGMISCGLFVLSVFSWTFTSYAPIILASLFSASFGAAAAIQNRARSRAA